MKPSSSDIPPIDPKRKPTKHSMKRRAHCHNYSKRGRYMLTLVVEGRHPLLGTLIGAPAPNVQLSKLGWTILHKEIPKIHQLYPNVEVWKTMIMPDHMHMIVYESKDFNDAFLTICV